MYLMRDTWRHTHHRERFSYAPTVEFGLCLRKMYANDCTNVSDRECFSCLTRLRETQMFRLIPSPAHEAASCRLLEPLGHASLLLQPISVQSALSMLLAQEEGGRASHPLQNTKGHRAPDLHADYRHNNQLPDLPLSDASHDNLG
jgi:hypothetical protein